MNCIVLGSMRLILCILFILISWGFQGEARADVSGQSAVSLSDEFISGTPVPYGWKPGYTDNVDDEVSSEPKEMILMEKPAFLNHPPLHDQIFTSELSNEFLFRYQQQFGMTEQEDNYFLTSREGYYIGPNGILTPSQQDDQRRLFAEYMLRRLAEFHTENIMKNDPQLKRVYEIKQSVSNMKVEMGPSMRFDLNYSFVGNFFQGKFTNPFATAFVTVNMDPGAMAPTAPREVYVMAQKPISRTVSSQAGYTFYGHAVTLIVGKQLTPSMSLNLSESYHLAASDIDGTDVDLTMLGFNLVF